MQSSAKACPPQALVSPSLSFTEGSEPHGSAVLRKPIPQAFFFFFLAVFIYFRYSINAICTAQVRSCQHFPLRLLFPGDGNLIATFVPGSSRPRRGLSAKASSTCLKTMASATLSLRDQFKMMEVDPPQEKDIILNSGRQRELFRHWHEVHGCRSSRVYSLILAGMAQWIVH